MPIRPDAASTSVEAQRSNSFPCSGSPDSPTITARWTDCAATGAARAQSRHANANPFVSSWIIVTVASNLRSTRVGPGCLRQADGAAVAPFRAQQSKKQHQHDRHVPQLALLDRGDRKSTRLNSSHQIISYAVFCLKKKKNKKQKK